MISDSRWKRRIASGSELKAKCLMATNSPVRTCLAFSTRALPRPNSPRISYPLKYSLKIDVAILLHRVSEQSSCLPVSFLKPITKWVPDVLEHEIFSFQQDGYMNIDAGIKTYQSQVFDKQSIARFCRTFCYFYSGELLVNFFCRH